ncbi:hypothetical protein NDU88_005000 [Pleurodeles waltl]|uniref:Uncharacterized protein n=1 Tax=Pleurodeles waltl TaxID=8319 RepID=A0AAV7TU39_PLEWA|nr:hypothetical protein NDU88_005000 [Pleurodeles waltl]
METLDYAGFRSHLRRHFLLCEVLRSRKETAHFKIVPLSAVNSLTMDMAATSMGLRQTAARPQTNTTEC